MIHNIIIGSRRSSSSSSTSTKQEQIECREGSSGTDIEECVGGGS